MGTSKYFNPGTNLDVTNATTSDETDINEVIDELILAFNRVEDDYLTLGPVVISGTTLSTGGVSSPLDINLVGSDYQIKILNDNLTNVTTVDTDGTLAANSDTRIATQKATKTYADTKLALSGGIMSGDIDMNGGFVSSLSDPTANQDAATKKYVDDEILSGIYANIYCNENIAINGDFSIDQEHEGAAVTGISGGTYFADMWYCGGCNHAAVVTAQRLSTGMGDAQYSGKITVTTADTLNTLGNEFGHGHIQFIEYTNALKLLNRDMKIRFKFRSNVTGTRSVAIQTGDGSKSFVSDFSYDSVSAEIVTVDVTVPITSSELVSGTNNRGFTVIIGRAATGTFATATKDQWVAGAYSCSTSATDWETTVSNYQEVTELQVHADIMPVVFSFRNHAEEFALCQRYFYKSYAPGVVPGTVATNGCFAHRSHGTYQFLVPFVAKYPVRMRTSPTVTLYSTGTGISGRIYNVTTTTDYTATAGLPGVEGFQAINLISSPAAGDLFYGQFVSDARM